MIFPIVGDRRICSEAELGDSVVAASGESSGDVAHVENRRRWWWWWRRWRRSKVVVVVGRGG